MYAQVHRYHRPKAYVYETKVTVANAFETPEAHHWVEALNNDITYYLLLALSELLRYYNQFDYGTA